MPPRSFDDIDFLALRLFDILDVLLLEFWQQSALGSSVSVTGTYQESQ